MASVDGGNRLLAAQALAQRCVVGEIEFVREVLGNLEVGV